MYYPGDANGQLDDSPTELAEKLNEQMHRQVSFMSEVLDTVDALVTVLDRDGRIVLFNKACEMKSGYTFDEVKGKLLFDLFLLADEKDDVLQLVKRINNGSVALPVNNINYWVARDGKNFLIAWSNNVLYDNNDDIQFIVSTGIDITQAEADQQTLCESERKYHSLFDCANDAIFLVEMLPGGSMSNYIEVNYVACERLGYTQEEMRTLSPHTIGVEKEESRTHAFRKFEQSGHATFEISLLSKQGEAVPFEFNVQVLCVNGKTFSLAIGRDITERRRSEAILKESEERYRALVEMSPDAIFLHRDHRFIYVNPATVELLRAPSREWLIGRSITEIIHPEYREVVEERLDYLFHSGKPSSVMEQKVVCYDGTVLDVDVFGTVQPYQGDNACQAVMRDITQRKQKEQEMLVSGKLQSVGKLAGGLAHEYNNILTVILGNLSVARIYETDDHIAKLLTEAEEAAQQAREVTQRLLTFASGGLPVKQPLNLGNVLLKASSTLLANEHITCRLLIPGDLLTVEADEGQLLQAISNIISNAVQSMPQGGTVTVSAENYVGYVKIAITDEGIGIAENELDKIIDPFYSTKPEGSGLGLSTAYSIVEKHGGYLTVESVLFEGTTVLIFLPAREVVDPTLQPTISQSKTGSGRVLLMDDEELLRTATGEMLTLLGYQMSEATDGKQVLELYQEAMEKDKPFDMVILDLMVSDGMGGKETMEKLLLLDPQACVIVSSGYSSDPVMSAYERYGFRGCLPKPYTIEELGKALELCLQQKARQGN
jgi:PAS domain S-box-containing protein